MIETTQTERPEREQSRFWSAVEKRPDGCWWWLRAYSGPSGRDRRQQGNAVFVLSGERRRLVSALRYAWLLAHGEWPGSPVNRGAVCGNAWCINPAHAHLLDQGAREKAEAARRREARLDWSARFWRKVDRRAEEECWPWLGARSGPGYGRFYAPGTGGYPHRASYILAHGAVPPGLVVRHTCDHRWCVNPAHLVAGTQAENVQDRQERSTDWRPNVIAAAARRRKLTERDLAFIRASYRPRGQGGLTGRQIAERLGVTPGLVYGALNGLVKARPAA